MISHRQLGAQTQIVYVVETTWPDKEDQTEFGGYSRNAFTHKDNPGQGYDKSLVKTHPELFVDAIGINDDTPKYSTPAAALRMAQFLTAFGRFRCGWENDGAEWRKKQQGPIKARVVEQVEILIRRVIE